MGLTPLFAYFIVYLAYLERYNQDEKSMSIFTSIKYQSSYAACTAGILLLFLVLWYIISLPLGFGGSIAV